jgi:exopolysaccharide production protein ExoQ
VGRGELWGELLAYHVNPVFGVGFESFWLGDRVEVFSRGPWTPNEAHNGYLETYLNLGLVGLCILSGVLIATFQKVRRQLLVNSDWGRVALGFLVAVVFYNWTEVSFRGLSLVWFAFYIMAMEYPGLGFAREPSSDRVGSENEMERNEVYV